MRPALQLRLSGQCHQGHIEFRSEVKGRDQRQIRSRIQPKHHQPSSTAGRPAPSTNFRRYSQAGFYLPSTLPDVTLRTIERLQYYYLDGHCAKSYAFPTHHISMLTALHHAKKRHLISIAVSRNSSFINALQIIPCHIL